MALIGKKWSFAAAHRLPTHFGKCANLHGHNYTVEVIVTGPVQYDPGDASNMGMVYDYYHLGTAWKEIEPLLDHKCLNSALPELHEVTTAENLACWLFDRFSSWIKDAGWKDLWVLAVRVAETDGTFAEVNVGDWERFTQWQKQKAQ
jgi:6-pyruvoyltetrahydropterin/6-carboxytetrahydropterin synthase